MKRFGIFLTLGLGLFAGFAQAQATRTWVSGVGDDANPCSRTAPCKTFAGAISKTATGGIINVLDPGGFGSVTITKSITIEAEGDVAGVLNAGTNGFVINASATDRVVLRNMRINGVRTGLDGVRILSAAQVLIEDTTIEEQAGNAVEVAPTTGSVDVILRNVTIRDVAPGLGDSAVRLAPTGTGRVDFLLEDSRVFASQTGLHLTGAGDVVIRNSVVDGGLSNGLLISGGDGVAATGLVERSVIRNFGAKGLLAATNQSQIFVTDSTITGNQTAISVLSGGAVRSFGNNRVYGNILPGAFTSTLTPN